MPEFKIQPDSSALWSEMIGKVDSSVKGALAKLDEYQQNEVISPFLAETVRRMFFDSVTDDPNWLNKLMSRGIGSNPKYIVNQMEADGGYRLRKAAEYVSEHSGGYTDPGKLLAEYMNWQSSDEEEQ